MAGLEAVLRNRSAAVCGLIAFAPLAAAVFLPGPAIGLATSLALLAITAVLGERIVSTRVELGRERVARAEEAEAQALYRRGSFDLAKELLDLRSAVGDERTNLGAVSGAVAQIRDQLDFHDGDPPLCWTLSRIDSRVNELAGVIDGQNETLIEQKRNLGLVAGGVDELRRGSAGLDLASARYDRMTEAMTDMARRVDLLMDDLFKLTQWSEAHLSLVSSLSERLSALEQLRDNVEELERLSGLDKPNVLQAPAGLSFPELLSEAAGRTQALEAWLRRLDGQLRAEVRLLSDQVLAQSASIETHLRGDGASTPEGEGAHGPEAA